jgi:hypothetical protein
MANTCEYIETLYDLETQLFSLLQDRAIYDFKIMRDETKRIVIEISFYKSNKLASHILNSIYENSKDLVDMAVSVQGFNGGCVKFRYNDHTFVPDYIDYIVDGRPT